MGVFAVLFACLPGGIVAIVLANQAKAQHASGDYAGARSKLTYSYVVSGISLVLGVPLFLLYISN